MRVSFVDTAQIQTLVRIIPDNFQYLVIRYEVCPFASQLYLF